MRKFILSNRRAQATIEYLIIIAIVVVMALVSAGLLSNFFSEGDTLKIQESKARMRSGLVGALAVIENPDGNYLLHLKNNALEQITVTGAQIDSYSGSTTSTLYYSTEEKSVYLAGNGSSCTSGSYFFADITITYTDKYGASYTQVVSDAAIECSDFTATVVTPPYTPPTDHFLYFNEQSEFNGWFNYTYWGGAIKPKGELDWDSTKVADNNSWRDADLVLYYKFNDTNGGTGIIDSSAQGNTGARVGKTDLNAGGFWDSNLLSLNGTTGYISVPDDSSLDFTTDFSMVAWVYFNSLSTSQMLMCKYTTYSTDGFYINYFQPNDAFFFSSYSSGSGRQTITGATPFVSNKWYHVAVTKDNAVVKIYINGVDSTVTSGNHIDIVANNTAMNIGRSAADGQPLNGRLEEVKVYDRTLSYAEIIADYNRWSTDANYLSLIIDTTSATTDYNYLTFNTNNANDKNYHGYGEQLDFVKENDWNLGLKALWHYNGNATDSSGRGYNGSASGVTEVNCLWGTTCYDFDGTNGYVSHSNQVFLPAAAFTFSAWFFADTGSAGGRRILEYNPTNNSSTNKYLGINFTSTNLLQVGYKDAGWYNAGTPCAANVWNHVVVTYDGTTFKGYLNGTQFLSHVVALQAYGSAFEVRIGDNANNGDAQYNWDGKIEEVAAWSRALDANTVKELFNKGAARLGISHRTCSTADCSDGSTPWSDVNYSSNTHIDINSEYNNFRYFQFKIKPELMPLLVSIAEVPEGCDGTPTYAECYNNFGDQVSCEAYPGETYGLGHNDQCMWSGFCYTWSWMEPSCYGTETYDATCNSYGDDPDCGFDWYCVYDGISQCDSYSYLYGCSFWDGSDMDCTASGCAPDYCSMYWDQPSCDTSPSGMCYWYGQCDNFDTLSCTQTTSESCGVVGGCTWNTAQAASSSYITIPTAYPTLYDVNFIYHN